MTPRVGTLVLVAFLLMALQTPAGEGGPVARVDQPEFDFGAVEQGEDVLHSYVIANDGDAPLSIGRVETSCGCTAADPSVRTVPPGGTSEIRVAFNSEGRKGRQHKIITVHTSDPHAAEIRLLLRGTIRVTLELDPPRLNLLEVQPGEQRREPVSIRNSGETDVIVRGISSDDPNLEIVAGNGEPLAFPLVVAPGASVKLGAVYRFPEQGRSFYYGRASFDVEGRSPLRLRVSARRAKVGQAGPSQINDYGPD